MRRTARSSALTIDERTVILATLEDPPERLADSSATRVVEGTLETVAQVVGARSSDEAGELVDGVDGDG